MDGWDGRERERFAAMGFRWMEVAWIIRGLGTGGVLGLLDGLLMMVLINWICQGIYNLIGDMSWSSCSAGSVLD